MANNRLTIRGVDPALWKDARKAAISLGITVGELVNRAITLYLEEYIISTARGRKMRDKE